jgi:hypothetical protein
MEDGGRVSNAARALGRQAGRQLCFAPAEIAPHSQYDTERGAVGLRSEAKRKPWPSSEPDHHCYFCSTRTHSSLPSFPSNHLQYFFYGFAHLNNCPTHSHTQTRPPQRLGQSTHIGRQAKQLHRPSSISTATTAIVGAQQRLRVSSATTPIASLHHLITGPCQLQMGVHHCPITNVSREWYSSRAAGECGVYTGIMHPTPPHAPSSHDATQVESAGTQLPPYPSRDSFRHDRPPSGVRSKSTPPSRPSSSSVDVPAITHYPTPAPDRSTSGPSHQSPPPQSPPQRLYATLQVNVHVPPHSHPSTSTSTLPPSPAPPREGPDSYHVHATYAALDVSGVRGDGYEDGEELTRARLGSNRSLVQLPPSPRPSRNDVDKFQDARRTANHIVPWM